MVSVIYMDEFRQKHPTIRRKEKALSWHMRRAHKELAQVIDLNEMRKQLIRNQGKEV